MTIHTALAKPVSPSLPVTRGSSDKAVTLASQVRDLRHRFSLGLFDESVFEDAERLLVETTDLDPYHDLVLLNCRCLVAEILDQQGRLSLAQEAVKEGAFVQAKLRNETAALEHPGDLRLAQARLRFVADYARMHLYRRAQYREAKLALDFCASTIRGRLERPTFRCHGSLGMVSYYIGCAERQLGDLDAADINYAHAIDQYRARAEAAVGESLSEALALTRHHVAVILGLGLGWTDSQRGFLTRALNNNIAPAQVLLMGSGDQTHRAYLSLIRGSIMRSLAGSTHSEMLAEARRWIQQALAAFTTPPYRHQTYALRAVYELALCALAGQEFDEALRLVAAMREQAELLKDVHWQATAWTVRSRAITRRSGNPADALHFAEIAISLLNGHEETLGLIDAWIARADALLNMDDAEAARTDLGNALRLLRQAKPNPKIDSVIQLRMALSYTRDGNTREADRYYSLWANFKANVEHQLVHEMATEVDEALRAMKRDFSIPWAGMSLKYAEHDKRLRAWLIGRATGLPNAQSKQQVADALGISRPTLYSWESELKRELATGG